MSIARPLYLSGMMGTGKSAVGQAAAARAHVPFVDLDALVEERAGLSIADLFQSRGEASFRALERELLETQLADPTPRVIALGGGAVLDKAARLRVLSHGTLITLTAVPAELVRRLASDRVRPLLGDDESARLTRVSSLLEARESVYREAHAIVDTTSRSVDQIAAEVCEAATLDPIVVPLGERTYRVEIVPGRGARCLDAALDRLAPSRVVLVTDETVDPLLSPQLASVFGKRADLVKVVLPAGERHKTLASVETILRAAVDAPVDRRAVVVGVGGGVVTDMAGLAAALALRGVRWIAVPTTVLAMVDASVGGKTAVDLGAAKNAIGAFHQPASVIVDPNFTRTESDRAFRSGLAEVAKTALIGDPAYYAALLQPEITTRLVVERNSDEVTRAVRSSIAVKAAVVARDEREAGERAHLNLGHTIGHALEAEGGFERLTHGEAVSLGMVAALRIGVALGVTPNPLAAEVEDLLARLGLPVNLDAEPWQAALRWVAYDKKREDGTLRMILVRAPGSVTITRVAAGDLPHLLAR